MYGHDPQRTGRADDDSLTASQPVPIWVFPYPEGEVEPIDSDFPGVEPNFELIGPDWQEGGFALAPDAYDGDFLFVATSSAPSHSGTWTFLLADQVNWMVGYYVYVWFPSFTGNGPPHTEDAEYTVEIVNDSGMVASSETFTIDQNPGGTWTPLTSKPFLVREDQYVVVRLTNRTREASTAGSTMVVADAVKLEQDMGSVLSSPAMCRQHDLLVTCRTENRPLETVGVTDPTSGTPPVLQSGSRNVGVVYGIATEDSLVTSGLDERGIPQWWFPYDWDNWVEGGFSSSPVMADVAGVGEVAYVAALDGQVYAIKTDPAVASDQRLAWQGPGYILDDPTDAGGWGYGNHSGYQGSGYRQAAAVDSGSGGEVSAFWSLNLSRQGEYAFYVWIPPSTSGETYIYDAEYTIRIGSNDTVVRVNQAANGGRWIRLGGYTVRSTQLTDISVRLINGFQSYDSGVTRYVAADALKVVPADLGSFDFSSPAVSSDGKTIYVGSTSGRVCAFEFGKPDPVWMYPSPGENRIGAVYASPALSADGDTLYIGSADGHVYALKTTGSKLSDDSRLSWVYPSKDPDDDGSIQVIGEISSTTAIGDKIYVGVGSGTPSIGFNFDTSGRVIALTKSGQLDWIYPNDVNESRGAFLYSSPLLADIQGTDAVVIGSTDGYLYALDPDTGNELWGRADLYQGIYSSAAGATIASEGSLRNLPMAYVGTQGGTLYGVDLRSGRRHWWYNLHGAVTSSPAVCENRLYVGDMGGVTWAFSDTRGGSETWNQDVGPEAPGDGSEGEAGKGRGHPEVDIFTEDVYKRIQMGERFSDANLHKLARAFPNSPADPLPFEWGETIYVVTWNLFDPNEEREDDGTWPVPGDPDFKGKTDSRIRLTFKNRAPGAASDTVTRRDAADKGYIVDSAGDLVFYAKHAYVLGRSSRSNTQAPGSRITVSVEERAGASNKGAASGRNIVPRHPVVYLQDDEDPETDSDLTDPSKNAAQEIAINNPLGLVYIDPRGVDSNWIGVTPGAWTTRRDDPLAQVNGNPGSPWVRVGDVPHGTNSDGHIAWVCDRSLMRALGGLKRFRVARNDLAWTGGPNDVISALPWDQAPPLVGPNASFDYPDIPSRQAAVVMVDSRLDPTQENVDLRPAPITGVPGPSDSWDVGRNPLSTAVTVPRFQPANLGHGYVGKVHVYIDSDGDGRLDKPAQLGAGRQLRQRLTGARAEAYREFVVQVHVAPDSRLEVVETTYDIGKVPHGFGFTYNPSAGSMPDVFYEDLAACEADFGPWFKSFTAYNLGNVNLLNVRMAKIVRPSSNPLYTLDMFSDTVEGGSFIPAGGVVSALDPEFLDDGAKISPVLGLPRRTFHKPRVGAAPTVLRIPDIPKTLYPQFGYNPSNPPPLPSFSIAVPTGTPAGTYSSVFTLFEDKNDDGIFQVGSESVGDPLMQAKITVMEGRLTDGVTPGSEAVPHLDRGDRAAPTGDATPAAYREPGRGNLRLFWASSRYGPTGSGNDPWYLYSSELPWHTDPSNPNVGQWVFAETSEPQWWSRVDWSAAYPAPASVGSSFFPSPDAANPNRGAPGALLLSTVKFTTPSVAVDDVSGRAWLFYGGQAFKYVAGDAAAPERKTQESRAFYTEITGGNLGRPVFSSTHDWTMPKYGIRGAAARIGSTSPGSLWLWTFWYGGNNNKWRIYYNANLHPDDPDAWSNDTQLSLPKGLTSAAEPSPVFRPVTARDGRAFDIVYSGFSEFHKNADIYLSRYMPQPRGYNPRTGRMPMDLRKLPPIRDEELARDPSSAVWYSKHVDWSLANLEITVYPDRSDPLTSYTLYPINAKYTRDRQTGALIYVYDDEVDLRRLFRSVVINREAGTVKFLRDPGPAARVVATYIPTAYRLTTDSAADVSPYALLDDSPNPRYRPGYLDNPFYVPSNYDENNPPPTDRFWVFWRRPAPAMKGTSVFYKSFRYTVRPNHQIAVDTNWKPRLSNIRPAPKAPVEVDWVKNRLYFTSEDEGKEFAITYTDAQGVDVTETVTVQFEEELDAQGNAFGNLTSEMVNEGQVCAFKDPVENKLWVFWTSTRSGNTDIYYEAISPRFHGVEFK